MSNPCSQCSVDFSRTTCRHNLIICLMRSSQERLFSLGGGGKVVFLLFWVALFSFFTFLFINSYPSEASFQEAIMYKLNLLSTENSVEEMEMETDGREIWACGRQPCENTKALAVIALPKLQERTNIIPEGSQGCTKGSCTSFEHRSNSEH